MATKADLYKEVKSKEAFLLTIDAIPALIGKKIATLYFGYRGQDGFKEFVVGEVIQERPGVLALVDDKGKNTFIRIHENEPYGADGIFTCSDSDREVYYILCENEN